MVYLFGFFVWINALGTTAIAVRNDKEIFIGVDGQTTIYKKGIRVGETTACKIMQAGNIFFVFTGNYDRPNFDAPKIITLFDTIQRSFTTKVNTFNKEVMKKLPFAIDQMRLEEPDDFRTSFRGGKKTALKVIIAGIENGIPILHTIQYQVVTPVEVPVEITPIEDEYAGNIVTNNPIIFGIGYAILDSLKRYPFDIVKDDIAKCIGKWLEWEIAGSDLVGPPISILRITPSKTEWIVRGSCCPEIQNEYLKKK
jgi:hypothetical protein